MLGGCDDFDAGVVKLSCMSEAAERARVSQGDALNSFWAVEIIMWVLWTLSTRLVY